jgi:hypothetical protein
MQKLVTRNIKDETVGYDMIRLIQEAVENRKLHLSFQILRELLIALHVT